MTHATHAEWAEGRDDFMVSLLVVLRGRFADATEQPSTVVTAPSRSPCPLTTRSLSRSVPRYRLFPILSPVALPSADLPA